MSEITDKIVQDIAAEYEYQLEKWGVEFDDKNTVNDWVAYLANYSSRASNMESPPSRQRESMVKVATLAVAAIAAFDRNGQFPPRHYEERCAKIES